MCISLGGCLTTASHTGVQPGLRRAPTEGRPQTVAWAEGKPHGQQSEGASRDRSMQAVRWPNILTSAQGAHVAWQWVSGPGGREKPYLSPLGLGGMSFCAHCKAPKEGPRPWLHVLHRHMLHHMHRTPPPCLLATWPCGSPTPGVAASPTCLLLPGACAPSVHSCHPASTHTEQHSRARCARSANRLRTFPTGVVLSPRQTPGRQNHWAGGGALR